MSSPIQQKLGAALKGISRIRTATELTILADATTSNFENALNFEAQLDKTQKEAKTLEVFLDDIREALTAWTDLLRKQPATERDTGETEFNAFNKKEKINEKVDDATTKLRDIRDLIGTLSINAKLFRNKYDMEERAAQAAHAQTLQKAATPATHGTPTPTARAAPFFQIQPVQLEKFAGNKRQWPEFYESFKSAIGSHALSKAEKFNILRNLLIGEARELVAGFRLEDQNYDIALQLLKDTYGAPEEHIRCLHFELANLKACKNLRDTREFLLHLERLTRELLNAGADIEGPPTYLMLEKKLTPPFLRTILNKKGEDPEHWNTSKFRNVLSEAVRKESQISEVMAEYGHFQARPAQPQARQQRPFNNGPRFRERAPFPQIRERSFITSAVDEKQKRFASKQPQHKPVINNGHRAKQFPQPNMPKLNEVSRQFQPRPNGISQNNPPSPCSFAMATIGIMNAANIAQLSNDQKLSKPKAYASNAFAHLIEQSIVNDRTNVLRVVNSTQQRYAATAKMAIDKSQPQHSFRRQTQGRNRSY